MEHNNYSLRRRPTPDLPRLTRRQQRLYERFDTLSDACWNLSQAISALSDCREDDYADDLAALRDISGQLSRDRSATQAQLERLAAAEEAAQGRDYERSIL